MIDIITHFPNYGHVMKELNVIQACFLCSLKCLFFQEESVLKVLDSAERVSGEGGYPVYLCPPLFTPSASATLLGTYPFLRSKHPVSKSMFLCATKWMSRPNLLRKAVKVIYHLPCSNPDRSVGIIIININPTTEYSI